MRPHVRLILRLDQLSRDSHLVRIAAHASFENVLHPEFAADLIHLFLGMFVVHHGRARDHPQMLRIECGPFARSFLP